MWTKIVHFPHSAGRRKAASFGKPQLLIRQAHHLLSHPERSPGTGRGVESFTPLASWQVPGLCIGIELKLHWHGKPIYHSID